MTIEYFLDNCTIWELNDILENIPYCDKTSWEIGRLIAFINAKGWSKGVNKLTDICSFKWEEDTQSDNNIEISKTDIERLKKESAEIYEHIRYRGD